MRPVAGVESGGWYGRVFRPLDRSAVNYERLSDEELLALIADGQSEALEVLYERYGRLVFSLARRILTDRESAEEVVQDTFVTIWRQADRYRPLKGRPYSWMVRIARNRAIDELRRMDSKNRRQKAAGVVAETAPDPALKVTADSRFADLQRIVSEALASLPDPQREVVELSYFRGWSQAEISRRTGLPLGTVKTRMRLALDKLRRNLGSEADEHLRHQDGI
jgi:RNA polymerase sigma-70 factor (ECF subfamily)